MKHVMIIDDSSVIRKYARFIFESLDFRVSDTDNVADALDRIKRDTPDIILADWIIPGANVYEFMKTVRAAKLDREIYVIYMTTENDALDLGRALRCGAHDYILKPFNRDIVEMKLHEIKVSA